MLVFGVALQIQVKKGDIWNGKLIKRCAAHSWSKTTIMKDLFNVSIVSRIQCNLMESNEDFYLSLLLLMFLLKWKETV